MTLRQQRREIELARIASITVFLPALLWLSACSRERKGEESDAKIVVAAPFTVTLNPMHLNLVQGESTSALLVVTPVNGFKGEISFSVDSAPPGVSLGPFDILTVSDGHPVGFLMLVDSTAETPLGTGNIHISASSGSLKVIATLGLTVAPPPKPSVSLSLQPSAASIVQGSNLSIQFTVKPVSGFTGAVFLSLDSPPPGLSIDLSQVTISGNEPVVDALTVSTTDATPEGFYSLKLKAESSSFGVLTSLHLTVLPPPPPGAPSFNLMFGIKTLQFVWTVASGAEGYKLFAKTDAEASFVQVGPDFPAATTSFDLPVALHWKEGSIYMLQACNKTSCSNSNEVSVAGELDAMIGYFKASNTDANDYFGASLALSGDGNTLAVAARYEDSNATGIGGNQSNNAAVDSGAVYVFVRNGASWSQQAYIKASNTGGGDTFGFAISLSADGNTLAVGAPGEDSATKGVGGDQSNNAAADSGAVYVFVRNGANWSQQAYIKVLNTDAGDAFGGTLDLSADGNTLAVGAVGEDSAAKGVGGDQSNNAAANSGAVYVFVRNGANWSQQAYIKASNTDANDFFGAPLALAGDGNTLAVGASAEDSDATGIDGDQSNNLNFGSGAVYVFTRSGASWSQQAYIKASNAGYNDSFGFSLDLAENGDTLAVGARFEDSNATGIGGNQSNNAAVDSGAVYVFVRNGANWSQQAYIKASNTEGGDLFGYAISLSADGNTLAVGAVGEDSAAKGVDGDQSNNAAADSGAVYVFVRNGANWSQQAYIKASNTDANDFFGWLPALSDDGRTLAVGAYAEDSSATGIGGNQNNKAAAVSGAVYLY